ncbi:MAG: CBS domain-containing protein [Acidimicrobiia bacterium]|nr:CBS domain-containing protein [Acidimicrobiia bacterium]
MAQQVREVMTTDLVVLHPSATLQEAAEAMRDNDIGNVLVNGDNLGIITDRDLVVRAIAKGCASNETIGSFSSTDLFTVDPNDDVADVAKTMAARKVRRVPVVESNSFVGILSIGDLAEDYAPDSVLGDISEAPPNN